MSTENRLAFDSAVIVGATGPTGIHLAGSLKNRALKVRVVSRSPANLERFFGQPAFDRFPADMLRPEEVQKAVDGFPLVFNCVGFHGGQMPFHPVAARNLAKALAATRARCVHVSSYWAYLPVARLPVSEEHPRAGGGDWVRLRREAEDVLRDVGSAILNLPDFFGPHVHTGTLQQALAEAAQGKTMNWIGSADTRHEYVFVPDAMEAACELSRRQEAYGSHWIVPGAGPITGRRAAEIASEMLGRPVAVRGAGAVMLRLVSLFNKPLRDFMQMVPDYIRPIAYDGSKLKNLLGTLPMTPYEEAIRQTLGWLNGRSSQAG